MSKIVQPLRVLHTRQAKLKASSQIKKYFEPKRTLDPIPENNDVPQKKVFVKKNQPKKDVNNNIKRNYSKFSTEQEQLDEKESIGSDSKRKKSSLSPTKLTKIVDEKKLPTSKRAAKKNVSSGSETDSGAQSASSSSSSDLDIVFDTSVESDSVIVVDSSMASNGSDDGFDGLHTDDSTENEEDDCHDRPYWSLYHNRVAIVIDQGDVKTKLVDQFFGYKMEAPKSREIFPKSAEIPRRRSTAVWNTPPRYSMMPKY